MREGAQFGTVQTHRVQAGQGEKKGLCLPLSRGGGTGNEGARVPLDGERERKGTEEDEITDWIT